ncbi:MAG TPA: OmpA family protein, partial [Terriglobales bacterium]|nr:OmpA family protein [Terriglobales bacterium]
SPSQTFVQQVEVHGSDSSADSGFVLLASATLSAHQKRGETTDLAIAEKRPVRWIKLRLSGGLALAAPKMTIEFSEIIGNGEQQSPVLADNFNGSWRGKGVQVDLQQHGAVVSGCYDDSGELSGTVTGNILYATGIDRRDKVPSSFILSVAAEGALLGLRSTNQAPFKMYAAPSAKDQAAICPKPPEPKLGCGSIIHGIRFAYDSAEIQPSSEPVLAELYHGLAASTAGIVIAGHTSSEGSDGYNQSLSERRAQAVVADLTRRGIAASRLSATGYGEKQPIAANDDENGRSLNRRVEVQCN